MFQIKKDKNKIVKWKLAKKNRTYLELLELERLCFLRLGGGLLEWGRRLGGLRRIGPLIGERLLNLQ